MTCAYTRYISFHRAYRQDISETPAQNLPDHYGFNITYCGLKSSIARFSRRGNYHKITYGSDKYSMLMLNKTVRARDNIIAVRRAVLGDNNKIAVKKKLNALNREFFKSLGFIIRKE